MLQFFIVLIFTFLMIIGMGSALIFSRYKKRATSCGGGVACAAHHHGGTCPAVKKSVFIRRYEKRLIKVKQINS
jgi:hypothetical protein